MEQAVSGWEGVWHLRLGFDTRNMSTHESKEGESMAEAWLPLLRPLPAQAQPPLPLTPTVLTKQCVQIL